MTIQADKKYYSIAKRYAKALIEIANSNVDVVEHYFAELKDIVDIIFNSQELIDFIAHPNVTVEDKRNSVKELFYGKIDQNIMNFLCILVDENRLDVLPTVLHTFEEIKNDLASVARVIVVSAVELYEDEKTRLQEKLTNKFNKKVVIDYEVKKEIIAGLIIKSGNNVVDCSLATKFENMKKVLI